MIQSLSNKYKKHIAWPLFVIFYMQIISPLAATAHGYSGNAPSYSGGSYFRSSSVKGIYRNLNNYSSGNFNGKKIIGKIPVINATPKNTTALSSPKKLHIGGPSSPEASAFKAVGSNDLVNLATGDFSYSIPLLDVGGYPVNLFYSGGVTMEQEASWVGLGWNINPGTVNRNMRGVPDDFNGTDSMIQTQNVKPNRTWGGEIGADVEVFGIKKPDLSLSVGGSIGFSFNNYLGPALEVGGKVSLSLTTSMNLLGEKSAPCNLGLTAAAGAKLSSRSGLTFTPSLNANATLTHQHVQAGVGLSTSYNSRTGIKELNIHSEMGYYGSAQKYTNFMGKEDSKTPSITPSIGSATISFAKPSYLPALRMAMQNSNVTGQVELGLGAWGIRGAVTATGYYSESIVPDESKKIYKPLVGYMYSENAMNNKDAVMDFNRLADAEVTPNTPVISAPQYNYDVFSIQGEGTGGTIRAYRGDMGFVRDNVTTSKEKTLSFGVDIGIPFHYGANVNIIKTPTRVGGWEDANNKLRETLAFKQKTANSSFENIYFKNPGEATVTSDEIINRIGRDNLVRFQLGGSSVTPTIESNLEQFDKHTAFYKAAPLAINNNLQYRDKRTQVVTMLSALDASKVGLDTAIKNYSGTFDANNNIGFQNIHRIDAIRKAHHISEIDVLEQSGMRYVYGLPVYSVKQKDYTFSVNALPANAADNIVGYSATEPTTSSEHMTNKAKLDGYVQTQETPAYATSFLLTGLLSPDYVDVTGDGITEDDLGSAVKFDYNKSAENHKWRTPRNNSTANTAHFNEGIRTEKKDNKATISYGEREVWYLNAIESKSMVAIFKTSSRNDAKGVNSDVDGRINSSENANKKLSQIDLYTKAEIRAKGYANAKPVKSVIFNYDYSLCSGTPDNVSGGKLTLKSIYFSYNGQTRLNKDRYVFSYGDPNYKKDNPTYSYNASDRWGTYKPVTDSLGISNNPNGLTNADYSSTLNDKSKDDIYAGAWSLKKILLPSGGQLEIQYEADDYAYVQDRRACNMFNIAGLGTTSNYGTSSKLYNGTSNANDNNYVYIHLDQPLTATTAPLQKQEIYSKYLDGVNQVNGKKQLVFKLQVNMPKGLEPLTVYPEYDDYGICPNNPGYMYVHLKTVDGNSPLVNSSLGFLTENIPGQAFPGYDVDVDGLQAFLDMAGAMITNLSNAFKNVNQQMRTASKGRDIALANSFIRLANPLKIKYGGGVRVRSVRVKDNWDKMTGQYNSVYGQDYDYSTTENINGIPSVISSGVASYEPGIGSEENPFREILSFSNQMPLASAQYGAIEMPMLEGLYPSPNVVYSKVTVRSIHRKGTHGDSTLRSAIGKQVTEFYTAKDYPTFSAYTPMNTIDYKKNPFFSFFYKEIINRRTISQGFLVETNDMHGRMKSQAAYSESDEKTPITATYHTYKNTGKNGLNDKVDFVYNNQQGAVSAGNMGVDMELMTDVREFSIKSNGYNGQGQVDIIALPFIPPLWPIPTYFPLQTYTENLYRAVTCTKLINYHAIEDSVIVMDKGSTVSSKTIAFDAETGAPIVTRTANEFNDPIYTVSYPAYWAYSGTGLAYNNINREFTNAAFDNGHITLPGTAESTSNIFESGDELYITSQSGSAPGGSCNAASGIAVKLWAFDKNKNTTPLTVPVKDLAFIDATGKPYTMSGVRFRIVRSGKRNNLGLTVSAATAMKNPIQSGVLQINNTANIVSASAIEYKEKWQTDKDAFKKYVYTTCPLTRTEDCDGILEADINPYLKGLIGNYKPYRSYTYYGSRNETDPAVATAIRKNGYITSFGNFWNFNIANNLVPDYTNTKWVWNSQLTKVNAKGQELETVDPLNRYTAAEYGFAKNMPVAMTQNARYGESFAEGFEDDSYRERVNAGYQDTCGVNKYMNFDGLINGSVVNTDNLAFKAHTGSNVLKINPNTTIAKSIDVKANDIDSFNLRLLDSYTVQTPNYGFNVDSMYKCIYADSIHGGGSGYMGVGTYLCQSNPVNTQGVASCPSGNILSSYIIVPNDAYYDVSILSLDIASESRYIGCDFPGGNESVAMCSMYSGIESEKLTAQIYRMDNTLFAETNSDAATYSTTAQTDGKYWASTTKEGSSSTQVFFPKGTYKVKFIGDYVYSLQSTEESYEGTCYVPSSCTYNLSGDSKLVFSTPNCMAGRDTLLFYKTLDITNSCLSNMPIVADTKMFNPVFSLKPGKHMQFSAWVHEDCAATPCPKIDYALSNIEVWANGGAIPGSTIKRTGTIIEGWQKVEGDFVVPANATTAEVHFINSNTSAPMYVDDIRMHPFNANMKSYVYDPRTLRLSAELDENNYGSFYEYDEEGQLIRVKKETIQGVKTIKETRSAKQRLITDVQ